MTAPLLYAELADRLVTSLPIEDEAYRHRASMWLAGRVTGVAAILQVRAAALGPVPEVLFEEPDVPPELPPEQPALCVPWPASVAEQWRQVAAQLDRSGDAKLIACGDLLVNCAASIGGT
ncbi:hypothetical protein [Tsukamurella hominis]|uniref:hypothetical protein n=1 Tax=Tsukamurella hominis TaxID=1970232 RepID=UPI0039E91F8C